MPDVFLVLQLAIELAFAALAIRTVTAWVRQPDRRHGNLALALSSLAGVILLAPGMESPAPYGQLVTDTATVAFLISGYGLLMFRDSFVPLGKVIMRLITVAILAIGVFDIAVQLPANPESPHTPLQTLSLVATVAIWGYCILEPIVTFWLASNGRPAVEKSRLRAISTGYAGLFLVVTGGLDAGRSAGAAPGTWRDGSHHGPA